MRWSSDFPKRGHSALVYVARTFFDKRRLNTGDEPYFWNSRYKKTTLGGEKMINLGIGTNLESACRGRLYLHMHLLSPTHAADAGICTATEYSAQQTWWRSWALTHDLGQQKVLIFIDCSMSRPLFSCKGFVIAPPRNHQPLQTLYNTTKTLPVVLRTLTT
jgi:hypothetical protein